VETIETTCVPITAFPTPAEAELIDAPAALTAAETLPPVAAAPTICAPPEMVEVIRVCVALVTAWSVIIDFPISHATSIALMRN